MSGDTFSISHLDEATQAYIKGLRQEAANYRVERNEYKTKYSEAGDLLKSANEKLDQLATLESTNEDLAKKHTTLQEKFDRTTAVLGLPGLTADDAARLQGSNAEEWAADAKALSERLGGKTPPPSLPKDDAAGAAPPEPAEDPIMAAFRNAGLLPS